MARQEDILELLTERGELCRKDIVLFFGCTTQNASKKFIILKKRTGLETIYKLKQIGERQYAIEYIRRRIH